MSRSVTTPNALLGLLSIHPMSGYDIRRLIPWSIGHFWSESYGQIYPALKRMAAEGLVEKKTKRQKGKPDRNVYSLTDKGREELRGWLKLPPVEPPVGRNELLLKLFFGALNRGNANRSHVSAFIERHRQALAVYDAIGNQLRREQANDPQLPFWLMTLNYGKHESLAAVQWGQETLEVLEGLQLRATDNASFLEVADA